LVLIVVGICLYYGGVSNVIRLRLTDRIFFVTVCLHLSVKQFAAREYPIVLQAFEDARRRVGFVICSYVIMPDHWHALIWPPPPLTISTSIQQMKFIAARRLNQHRGTKGTVWLHQFWDRFVRSKRELERRMEYLEFNPVRKGLVSRPEDWVWSSFSHHRGAEAPILRVEDIQLPDDYRA
jgi:putative transposase